MKSILIVIMISLSSCVTTQHAAKIHTQGSYFIIQESGVIKKTTKSRYNAANCKEITIDKS